MNLAICVATMQPEDKGEYPRYPGDSESFLDCAANPKPRIFFWRNTPEDNLGVVGSYQRLYKESTEDILCYLHDDVICKEENWNERVIGEFEDPEVGLVGFGGALWHGEPDLYKLPYQLQRLRRGDYLSNVDDAGVHGARFTGSCEVSVLDGFCIIARRTFLDRIDGWNLIARGCDFFCYDYAISALARRLGYRIRCIAIRCHHHGGRTSVAEKSAITSPEAYEKSHRWFYEEFRDAMPAKVNP